MIVAALVITTLLSGVLASFLLKSKQKDFSHHKTSLESHDIEELRVLSCVYNVRHAHGAISLVSALSGSRTPFTPLLMHLVPLPKKRKEESELLYEVDHDEFGGNDGLEINDSIDSFGKDCKILFQQVKLVTQMFNMQEEICNATEDLRVSIVFLPFHKHQRIDGKTTNDGEIFRQMNRSVLRHASCSVGIFMDRDITGFKQPHVLDSVQHVAALFFGGSDDREGLTLCKYIVKNPLIHLTVIQFVSEDFNGDDEEDQESYEKEKDGRFIEDIHKRYVSTGEMGYIEKRVSNGKDTMKILQEIGEMYSLFVVGKSRDECRMTVRMKDWEECPELGTVGDFLASSLDVNASVLVVQKHRYNFIDDY